MTTGSVIDVKRVDVEDEVIMVTLPYKDYKVMREMISERQAMKGLKRWLTQVLFWLAGGGMSLFGVYEAFRRFGE